MKGHAEEDRDQLFSLARKQGLDRSDFEGTQNKTLSESQVSDL